jgi:hydrogenase expression/formation protein HypC
MCLAIPAQVLKIDEPMADIDLDGVCYKINMTLTPDIKVGDYVIVHAGFSIEKLDMEEAKKTLAIWEKCQNATYNG